MTSDVGFLRIVSSAPSSERENLQVHAELVGGGLDLRAEHQVVEYG